MGGGQPQINQTAPYPGPYGSGIGSIIPDYQFYGYPNASNDTSALVMVQLSDFYNPTGAGVYPAGSPYGAGNPLPKALFIDRAAVWCEPCNEEAKSDLPGLHTTYFPGGEFFLALDEGATPGTTPTQSQLTNWTKGYKVNFPAVVDPATSFSSVVGADAYPGQIIIRTKDMKIVTQEAGVAESPFWTTTFEKHHQRDDRSSRRRACRRGHVTGLGSFISE